VSKADITFTEEELEAFSSPTFHSANQRKIDRTRERIFNLTQSADRASSSLVKAQLEGKMSKHRKTLEVLRERRARYKLFKKSEHYPGPRANELYPGIDTPARTLYYPCLGPKWGGLVLGPYKTKQSAEEVRERIIEMLDEGQVSLWDVMTKFAYRENKDNKYVRPFAPSKL
jgi:hypothetical protein